LSRLRVFASSRLRVVASRMPALTGAMEDVSEAATAFLTALDTSLARAWREEDRAWRKEDRQWRREDMEFRVEERDWWHLEHMHREENRKWRRQDVEQRVLENARWIWNRYVEKNRRDVEEKGEQLRTTSNLSALIAGFVVVALVEFQFSEPAEVPRQSEALIGAYAAATTCTVILMLNSMVLCSFMLSNILRNGKTYVSEDEEAEFLYACRRFALGYAPGDTPPIPKRSFERYWETRCEADWRKAFRMFTYGVPMFLTTLTLSAWLKFWYSLAARLIVTLVAVLGVAIWFQTQRTWGAHLVKRSKRLFSKSSHLPPEGLPFDWHARPRHPTEEATATSENELKSSRDIGEEDTLSYASLNDDASPARCDTTTYDVMNDDPDRPSLRSIAIDTVSQQFSLREKNFLKDSSPRVVDAARREFDKVGLKSRVVDDHDANDDA